MRLPDFDALVRRLSSEVPPAFFEGVAEVVVSPKSVPHPTRADIYTLGECIPLPGADNASAGAIQSRIVLYHGSFVRLARLDPEFDWREEAWETLTHELRHHVEWRARAPALEAYDRAVEENFARHEGDRFDPVFYLDGESPVAGVYEVDGDFFLDRVVRALPESLELDWHGERYRAVVPPGLTLPAFVTLDGIAEPPPGELVLVLRRKPRLTDLFRRAEPSLATVQVTPLSVPIRDS
ncbi:MAG TPA: metallopeptidase family protein [Gemmatimonadales bacterium]